MQNHFHNYLAINGESQRLSKVTDRHTSERLSAGKGDADIINITLEMQNEMRETLGQIINRFKLDWNILR